MSQVTQILDRMEQGDPHAAEQLLPLVYDELRQLAAQRLAREKPGQTLEATALVHEAYLRLAPSGASSPRPPRYWDGRRHFFAAAAEAMRRILIERARASATRKRGGNAIRVDLDLLSPAADDRGEELIALDQALTDLERHDAQAAGLVKLR